MVYRPKVDDRLCFVLMPFREPFNGYYEHIIKNVVRAAGLEPLRGDEVFGTKSIIRDVWEHIWCARMVIADVTDRNPNVNYELGLCHSLGVPTILITQEIEDVPFDYRHRRCIVYHTEEATWVDKLSVALGSTIRAVLSDSDDDQELRWPYDTFVVKNLVGTNATISVPPRRLSGPERQALVQLLLAAPKGNIKIEAVNESEVLVFADDLLAAFREAEWTISPVAKVITWKGLPPTGVWVRCGGEENLIAGGVQDALMRVGIQCQGALSERLKGCNDFELVVGVRP